ncbi:nickel transporter [Kitasatospora sp. NPDC048239]|uniref:nickel transporter n=1 Tax=Kitasatospora sp. NPDC048239 TaxID=3364046 RepID=UPI0037229082
MTRRPLTAAACAAALLAALAATAPAARAHPLGNFTVNRYDGLRLLPDRIEDTVVVDTAEIPTAQEQAATDTDHDGRIGPAEAAARAAARCAELARAARGSVDGRTVDWEVAGSGLEYRPGAADLPTARLGCALRARADLGRAATVAFDSGADRERLGWKEVSASGDRVRLAASDVPAASVSNELRDYPAELTGAPPAVVSAALRTEPSGEAAAPVPEPTGRTATAPGESAGAPAGEPVLFPALERRLASLAATADLTVPVGLLALALALLLGAGHAALPGHAKLAVAACLARRRGGVRAALAVGATVTVTHTAGVLVTGLALTASMTLAGERLLGWLGAAGGALIAAIGVGLVVTAARTLTGHGHGHGHHHGHGHDHGSHGHGHGHDHGHSHSHSHDHGGHHHRHGGRLPLLGVGLAGGLVPSPSALVILLGAVALGRTAFGVLLVLGYGLGMALALTAAGLLLSGTSTRLAARTADRLPALRRYAPYGSLVTAAVVLAVGVGLALRSLAQV